MHWFWRATIAISFSSMLGVIACWELSRYDTMPPPLVGLLGLFGVLVLPSSAALLIYNGIPFIIRYRREFCDRCRECGYDLTGIGQIRFAP